MWQTLTPDILCQVFVCAINNTPLLTFEPHLFPWHLGHICSAWRDTFISCPEIWTYFVINFKQNYPAWLERDQISLEMVQLCLDRSKNCPIRFMFIQNRRSNRLEYQLSRNIIRALSIHSTRWKHAYFKMDGANFSTLTEVKNKLPILHSLYLFVRPGTHVDPSARFKDLFRNTPQLRHLSFNSYPLRKLDWSSLSTIHLTITKNTIAAPYFITHTSSKLEELVINGTLPDEILPLTFPSLKRLGVRFEGFLESLKTPILEDLSIMAGGPSPDVLILNRIASRFIREQGIPLNIISIYSNSIDETTILLRYVPDTTRHVYLYLWKEDIGPVLYSCPAARYLESVTCEYWLQSKYALPMVAQAESWREQSIMADSKGIGPFENMRQFSIVFEPIFKRDKESFADFVDRLKKPFEECGVKCSVRPLSHIANWDLMGSVSPHLYFNRYY